MHMALNILKTILGLIPAEYISILLVELNSKIRADLKKIRVRVQGICIITARFSAVKDPRVSNLHRVQWSTPKASADPYPLK